MAQWRREYTMETILIELRRFAIIISTSIPDANIPQVHGLASTQEVAATSRGLDVLV
jgi:hypothetical protein